MFFFTELLKFLPSEFPTTRTVNAYDKGMNVTCKVTGHPKPNITWFKDNMAISESDELYEIVTTTSPIEANGFNVTSTLYWKGN